MFSIPATGSLPPLENWVTVRLKPVKLITDLKVYYPANLASGADGPAALASDRISDEQLRKAYGADGPAAVGLDIKA